MKKAKILSMLIPLMAMGLAGCGNSDADENGDAKVNDIAKYEKDNSSHWIVGPDGAAGTKEKHTLVLDESKSTPASCKAKGEKVEVCSVCGYEKKTSFSKLEHSFVDDPTSSVAATCSTEGKTVQKCSVCGEPREIAVPKLAHTLGAGTEKTENGKTYLEYECSTCHSKVSSMIPFNTYKVEAGSFDDGKISKEPVGKISWTIQLPAGEYDVYFDVKFSSSTSAANRTFESRKVDVTYNDVAVDYDKTKTAEDVGMTSSSYTACTFFKITATGGVDKLAISNPDYRLVFDVNGKVNFVPVPVLA